MRAPKILIWALLSTAVASTPLMAQSPDTAKSTELHKIIDEFWAYTLDQYPAFASSLGVEDTKGRVSDASLEAEDKRVEKAKSWLKQLDTIDQASLSEDDKTNFGILHRSLAEQVEANSFGQRAINFTNRGGWHQSFASMQNNLPFRTAGNYRTYVNRLKQYYTVSKQSIAVADQALEGRYVQPCVSMVGYENSISGLITEDPRKSRFFEPFTKPKPDGIDAETFEGLAGSALATITSLINPALKEHLDWYKQNYAPNCAKSPGVSAQPGGDKYYDFAFGR